VRRRSEGKNSDKRGTRLGASAELPLDRQQPVVTSGPYTGIESVLNDPIARQAFEELCRTGRVKAEGLRVRFEGRERELGKLDLTSVVETKFEPIPPEDFADLALVIWNDECRLHGTTKWLAPGLGYEMKEWRSVRFRATVAPKYDPPPAKSLPIPKGRRGPEAGTIRRYDEADRALFPEIDKKMALGMSRYAAALCLARDGKVKGAGVEESRAKRLASLHKRERAETR
jgi:hypothetical protein